MAIAKLSGPAADAFEPHHRIQINFYFLVLTSPVNVIRGAWRDGVTVY